MEKIILDNDVISVFAEINRDNADIFKTFFDDFQKAPQVNQFVYDCEVLLNKPFVDGRINDNSLNLIEYKDYISPMNEKIYIENFKQMYNVLNQETIDDKIFDKCSGKNKGEIHSVLCAFYLGIAFFLSNDNHSELLKKHFDSARNSLQVYKVFDSCKEVARFKEHKIKKTQLDKITRCCTREQKQKISQIWNNS